MTEEDLAATSEEAVWCRQPTVSSAGPPSASSPPALSSADIAALKESFPLLAEFSDDFIRSTPRGDLMKLQSTAYKLKEAEKGKDADEKLAANKAALATKFYKVSEGKDNRWNCLHPSRFLAGAACSATKLWTAARQNVEAGYPEIGSYDMGAVGLAGHVSSRGWIELHNPQSNKMSIKLFNINNCASRAASKSATVRDNFSDDILDIGEFTLALRTMRMAFRFAMLWNFSVEAIEGFFCMTNYRRTWPALRRKPTSSPSSRITC